MTSVNTNSIVMTYAVMPVKLLASLQEAFILEADAGDLAHLDFCVFKRRHAYFRSTKHQTPCIDNHFSLLSDRDLKSRRCVVSGFPLLEWIQLYCVSFSRNAVVVVVSAQCWTQAIGFGGGQQGLKSGKTTMISKRISKNRGVGGKCLNTFPQSVPGTEDAHCGL